MGDEISEDRFRVEAMRHLTTLVTKVQENTEGIKKSTDSIRQNTDSIIQNTEGIEKNTAGIKQNSDEIAARRSDFAILGGHFQDIASVVIKSTLCLNSVEPRGDLLEQKPH